MPGFIIGGKGRADGNPPGNLELHRAYRWALESITVGGTSIKFDGKNNTIVEIDLPKIVFEELKVDGLNNEYKFAKKFTVGDISMSFYDFDGLYDEMQQWIDEVYTVEDGIKTNYKGIVKLVQKDNSGKNVENWSLEGAWPKELSHSKLSYKDESMKLIDVTFSYDFFTHS